MWTTVSSAFEIPLLWVLYETSASWPSTAPCLSFGNSLLMTSFERNGKWNAFCANFKRKIATLVIQGSISSLQGGFRQVYEIERWRCLGGVVTLSRLAGGQQWGVGRYNCMIVWHHRHHMKQSNIHWWMTPLPLSSVAGGALGQHEPNPKSANVMKWWSTYNSELKMLILLFAVHILQCISLFVKNHTV